VEFFKPIGNTFVSFEYGLHSPEYLILYKLTYFGLSQQSKHSRDIAAILKAKKNELDLDYIEQEVASLGLSLIWKEMLNNVS
jgi:hypothetical protein